MKTMMRLTALDQDLLTLLLDGQGVRLTDRKRLAAAVQKLSDYYLQHPEAPTPWQESWAVQAYACYYLPLNYLRVMGVITAAKAVGFFSGLSHYTDFGSGLGTVSLALDEALPGTFKSGLAVERSSQAIALHKKLQAATRGTPLTWQQSVSKSPEAPAAGHLSCFSYSLTELSAIPSWALRSEALMLIEPATHQDSRRLLAWREELLASGWSVWGPCTHAAACPLLHESKRDWCHDRIQWEAPAWFKDLEEYLPMRNGSLTYSYLLLRRQPPVADRTHLGRLTGDLKTEKGASRQMICRGPKREFLSWQHRLQEVPVWPRGERVQLAADIAVKSNELRPLAGQVELLP